MDTDSLRCRATDVCWHTISDILQLYLSTPYVSIRCQIFDVAEVGTRYKKQCG